MRQEVIANKETHEDPVINGSLKRHTSGEVKLSDVKVDVSSYMAFIHVALNAKTQSGVPKYPSLSTARYTHTRTRAGTPTHRHTQDTCGLTSMLRLKGRLVICSACSRYSCTHLNVLGRLVICRSFSRYSCTHLNVLGRLVICRSFSRYSCTHLNVLFEG